MHTLFARASLAVAVALSLSLAACGGGGGSSDSGAAADSGSSNTPGGGGTPGGTASNPTPQSYVGFFYNTSVRTGGWVGADLMVESSRITGVWEFTQDDDESTVLCGAGSDLLLTRTGTNYAGTFTSADGNVGCGFDAGWVFSLGGSSNGDASHLSGTYGVAGNGTQGVYDAWLNGPDELITCNGTGHVPADGRTPESTVQGVAAFYLGTQVLWGQLGVQNLDIDTGAPIACVTEGKMLGKRDTVTGAIEMKVIFTGRTGAECSATSGGSSYFEGAYSSASGLNVAESATTQPLTLTLNNCSVSKVSPSAAGRGEPALRQALVDTVRRHAR